MPVWLRKRVRSNTCNRELITSLTTTIRSSTTLTSLHRLLAKPMVGSFPTILGIPGFVTSMNQVPLRLPSRTYSLPSKGSVHPQMSLAVISPVMTFGTCAIISTLWQGQVSFTKPAMQCPWQAKSRGTSQPMQQRVMHNPSRKFNPRQFTVLVNWLKNTNSSLIKYVS